MLACTMQQEQIPIPPAVIISMISAAWNNSHTECNFFQFTVVFHVDNEIPICDARSMGAQDVHQLSLSTFLYCTSPLTVKSYSFHNIIWLHNKYTLLDQRYKAVVPCTISPYQLKSINWNLKPVLTEPTTTHTKAALTPSTFRSGRCHRDVASYALPDANNNSYVKTINPNIR
jgi:hypothetical protein